MLQKRGAAIKKRDSVLRMAEANKAFGHFIDFNFILFDILLI